MPAMNAWQASDLATAEACQVEKGEPPRTVTEFGLDALLVEQARERRRRLELDVGSCCRR
jgi:hypothetical protein